MSARRRARAVALQVLYAMDGGEDSDSGAAGVEQLRALIAAENLPEDDQEDGKTAGAALDEELAQGLIDGVRANRAAIDELLSSLSRKWRVERLARVDRNILRIAVYELRYRASDVPARVAINEAVELAKRFGAQEAPAFVNGLLDSALEVLGIEP